MKKLLILANFLLFTVVIYAQNDYFLFIQSENNQPYYVQTQGKTLSSSAIGHLIISGLKDSVYVLNVGFPKNQYPEQLFQVRMNRKDAGYQLKNLGTEGWALFNVQTLQLIKAQLVESKKQTIAYGDIKKTDVFSTLMAGLVNDSAVLYTSIAKAEPGKEDLKNIASDSPPSANADIVKLAEPNRKDSSIDKTDIVKQAEPASSDTLVAKAIVKAEPPLKDTLLVSSEVKKQNENSQKAPPVVQLEISKQGEVIKKDSPALATASAKQDAVSKTDALGDSSLLVRQLPNETAQKSDTLSQRAPESKSAETSNSVVKPLIIWFSETKTSKGTELVYFDMSVSDKIDTIKLLIPKDEAIANGPRKDDSASDKKEGQKSGTGNFFGKIFGKKDHKAPTDQANKTNPEANISTIKVTTVESKKSPDSVVVKTKDPGTGPSKVEVDNDGKVAKEQKTDSNNFFNRIFGKKNAATSQSDSISSKRTGENRSSVKVTTIENSKSKDSAVTVAQRKKEDETTAEVEKLKKDQEEEERTSTQRFFGKFFGKKKDAKPDNPEPGKKVESGNKTPAAKVSTVESKSVAENNVKSKVIVTNSDCRDFAGDSDVEKLRVRMLGEKDTDAQISEARKIFKVKCFSSKQIESLSTLFRTDEGKYKLFDAAYPFVSDTNNFKSLVGLLTEEYYINRFNAMVRI